MWGRGARIGRKVWRRVLAVARLSKAAVCEESRGRGLYDDFHDWPDSTYGRPLHFMDLTCRRCGKVFRI